MIKNVHRLACLLSVQNIYEREACFERKGKVENFATSNFRKSRVKCHFFPSQLPNRERPLLKANISLYKRKKKEEKKQKKTELVCRGRKT